MVDKAKDTYEVPHTDGMINNVQSHVSWFDYNYDIGPEPVLVEDLSIVDKTKDRCKVSQTDGMVIL